MKESKKLIICTSIITIIAFLGMIVIDIYWLCFNIENNFSILNALYDFILCVLGSALVSLGMSGINYNEKQRRFFYDYITLLEEISDKVYLIRPYNKYTALYNVQIIEQIFKYDFKTLKSMYQDFDTFSSKKKKCISESYEYLIQLEKNVKPDISRVKFMLSYETFLSKFAEHNYKKLVENFISYDVDKKICPENTDMKVYKKILEYIEIISKF